MRTWEAVLRARASGSGAEADAARLALAELDRLLQLEHLVRAFYRATPRPPRDHPNAELWREIGRTLNRD